MISDKEAQEATREVYETDSDRGRQNTARVYLETIWGCEIHTNPRFYETDWTFLKDNKVKAFGEFKYRNYSYEKLDSMGGINLSLHKHMALCHLHILTLMPALLVIQLPTIDNVPQFYYNKLVLPNIPKISVWGRKDRGDRQDIEPAVQIPMDGFVRCNPKNGKF